MHGYGSLQTRRHAVLSAARPSPATDCSAGRRAIENSKGVSDDRANYTLSRRVRPLALKATVKRCAVAAANTGRWSGVHRLPKTEKLALSSSVSSFGRGCRDFPFYSTSILTGMVICITRLPRVAPLTSSPTGSKFTPPRRSGMLVRDLPDASETIPPVALDLPEPSSDTMLSFALAVASSNPRPNPQGATFRRVGVKSRP